MTYTISLIFLIHSYVKRQSMQLQSMEDRPYSMDSIHDFVSNLRRI